MWRLFKGLRPFSAWRSSQLGGRESAVARKSSSAARSTRPQPGWKRAQQQPLTPHPAAALRAAWPSAAPVNIAINARLIAACRVGEKIFAPKRSVT